MFTATTTYAGGKPYSWSYTKLKNYRTCPKRCMHHDILPKGHPDKVPEPESAALTYGNDVHHAMHHRIEKGTPLPAPFAEFEKHALPYIRAKELGMKVLVEQKLAIRRDFSPCGYFDGKVWFRSIADVVTVAGKVAAAIDWKTGKVEENNEQLLLVAATVFAAYPQVQTIKAKYVWLAFDAVTDLSVNRDQMPAVWAKVMPELDQLEHATVNMIFPPKPNYLCKNWCEVRSCVHHGKSP